VQWPGSRLVVKNIQEYVNVTSEPGHINDMRLVGTDMIVYNTHKVALNVSLKSA
jgi:hypothetical protein